jgi:hypothetical protein
MRKDGLGNYTWSVSVSNLINVLIFTFYRACYLRLFIRNKKASRKVKIELSSGEEDEPVCLSSGDENDTIEVKPKIEEMEPCCSSSLRD